MKKTVEEASKAGISEEDLTYKVKYLFLAFVLESCLPLFPKENYGEIYFCISTIIDLLKKEDCNSAAWKVMGTAACQFSAAQRGDTSLAVAAVAAGCAAFFAASAIFPIGSWEADSSFSFCVDSAASAHASTGDTEYAEAKRVANDKFADKLIELQKRTK